MAVLLINQGTNSAVNFDLSGTVNTQVVGLGYGTLSTIGTLPNIPGGSIVITAGTFASLGTIGTVGLATISGNLGTIGTVGLATVTGNVGVSSGTISVLPNLPQGSINVTAGTITTGTINLGTVVGKDANAAAQTGFPIGIGGTDSGGTIRTINVDSTGAVKTATTVNVTVGTINAGTINTGTINIGTITGKDANAAAQTSNPVAIGGTDSGGTVRTVLVDSTGAMKVSGASAGTFVNLTTGTLNAGTVTLTGGTLNLGTITGNIGTISMLSAGTLTTIPNIPGGTINLAQTVSTVSMLSAGTLTTIPNIPGGTVNNIGTVVGVGTISNIGSLGMLTAGTISMLNAGTISSLPNLPQGSIQVTAGTVSAGTINVGTVQLNPLTATNLISHAGTSGTLGIGTLVGTASIGAGTALYPTGYRIIVVSGTAEVVLAFGSQTNGNQVIHHGLFPAGGGIANPITYPHGYGTTNSPLTYQILSGAGTVSWDVDYFTHT